MKCTNLALWMAVGAFHPNANAFLSGSSSFRSHRTTTTPSFVVVGDVVVGQTSTKLDMTIVSPFDAEADADTATADPSSAESSGGGDNGEPLDLTWDNVEMVLDTMRSYLIQDGGNVIIADIDGPVVKLELQGACGTCPSSTQTMKMGLERGLKERIPEIQEVIQSMPEGPPLNEDEINVVLDGVRPFLDVAGGSIDITSITGVDSVAPAILLKMSGASASLNSVKLEIAQRLQRHFMMSGLRVEWDE